MDYIMLDDISNYFNNNPVIGILLVVIIIGAILYFYNNYCPFKEGFDPSTINSSQQNNLNTDNEFNKQYVGQTKILNFKTKIDGKEYYLANIKLSQCQSKDTLDCSDVGIVLIDAEDIQTQIRDYTKDLATAQAICQSTKTITCQSNLPPNATAEQKEKCNLPDISCAQKRFFNHDFTVVEIKDITSDKPVRRRYVLRGTAVPAKNGDSFPAMLNQHLYDEKGIPSLCGDLYTGPETQYTDIVVVENVKQNDGGIIGGMGSNLKIKLRFNTKILIISKDSNGNPTYTPIIDSKGKPTVKSTYVGYCSNNYCKLENGKTYKRVCLVDDPLNPNVLEFEPIIVSI